MTENTKPKRGRWKAGESGNPAGRVKGINKTQALRDALGSDRLQAIVGMLADKALNDGDVQAARVLLDRCIPPLRAVEPPLDPLAAPENGSVLAHAETVMRAVLAGAVSPSQGAALMGSLAALAKVKETEELEARLLALEEREAVK